MDSRNSRLTSIAIAAVIMFAGQLQAGVNRWTSSGPEGGSIAVLLSDRSNPAILYAAVGGGGVSKSTDRGASWKLVNSGLFDLLVSAMAIRRDEPSTLFAGTEKGRLFRTRDGGEHWTLVGEFETRIGSVAVNGQSVYVLSGNREMKRSRDGGETWDTLTGVPTMWNLRMLEDRLYAVGDQKVYTSGDGGTTWTILRTPLSGWIFALAVDEETSTLMVSTERSVAATRDHGNTWEEFPALPAQVMSLATFGGGLANYTGGILVGTTAGVFRIYSEATEWMATGDAHVVGRVGLIVAAEGNPDLIFAFRVNAPDLFVWSDVKDWTRVNTSFRTALTNDVAVSGSSVYAATNRGLYSQTADSGGWQFVPVMSSGSQSVDSVTVTSDGALFAGMSTGMHKSVDAGITWTHVTPAGVGAGEADASQSDPKTIYSALTNAMSKSTDGGATWVSIQSNLPYNYYFWLLGFYVQSVDADPKDPNTVYVTVDHDVHKSVDGGAQWRKLSGFMRLLAIDTFDSSILYAVANHGVLLTSKDAGTTWERLEFPGGHVTELAGDPARRNVVYAANSAGEVFRSANGGLRWEIMSAGLNGAHITRLTLDPTGNRLYASTTAGVFEYERDPARLEGGAAYVVSFETSAKNFLSAEDCGGGAVNANATSAGPCETFTLLDIDGGSLEGGDLVHLVATNGAFVVAEDGGAGTCNGCDGRLNANRLIAGAWETFTIHIAGDSISLQSRNGSYVAAENGGRNGCNCESVVRANRERAGAWETFTMTIR